MYFLLACSFSFHLPHQGGTKDCSFETGERLPASYYSGPVDSQVVLAVFGVTELQVSTHDCTAHSAIYSPATNGIRALDIFTDTWCSSGQFRADGTLVQTGGNADGFAKVLISFTYYHFSVELTPTANYKQRDQTENLHYLYSHSIVGRKNSLNSFLQATCPHWLQTKHLLTHRQGGFGFERECKVLILLITAMSMGLSSWLMFALL